MKGKASKIHTATMVMPNPAISTSLLAFGFSLFSSLILPVGEAVIEEVELSIFRDMVYILLCFNNSIELETACSCMLNK